MCLLNSSNYIIDCCTNWDKPRFMGVEMAHCLMDSGKIKIDYIQKHLFMTMILTTNNRISACMLSIRFDSLLKHLRFNYVCHYAHKLGMVYRLYTYLCIHVILWFYLLKLGNYIPSSWVNGGKLEFEESLGSNVLN